MAAGTRVGDVLAAKYRLEELLGSGGMGHVYRAVNVEIERSVAIKVLRSEHAQNASLVDRFLREARAANLVRHPNVVDVVDIGRDSDGSPFIVQELLRGEDLGKYVERRGGKLTLAEVEDILLPVIDAVAEAHARGVVHRDIKPDNVFLAEQGRQRVPKLLDFGISKVMLPNIKATEVGVMMGTPAYMAPEQVQGARDADPRSDVWALGIMLFELLAGRLPFDAVDAPALFVAVATKDVPPLLDFEPDLEPAISTITARCLRRLPAERYPSALELARDLRHVFDGEAIENTQTRSILPEAYTHPSAGSAPAAVPDLAFAAAPTVAGPFDAPPPTRRAGQPSERRVPLAPVDHPPSERLRSAGVVPSAPSDAQRANAPTQYTGPAAQPDKPISLAHSRFAKGPAIAEGMHASPRLDRRAVPSAYERRPVAAEPDMSFLVAIAVVGLTTIGTTALLTSFMHQPEGWPVVHYVTKPTSTLNLAVQGGLGLLAFVLTGRFAIEGNRKWRGDVMGGRTGAVLQAVLAGGCLYAAVELFRAAW